MSLTIVRETSSGVNVLPYSNFDYVSGGNLYKGQQPSSILVGSSDDLEDLTDYVPGSIAFTVGYANMWMLAADGTWTEFPQPEESD